MLKKVNHVHESICPRCEHHLVPVHAREGRRRRIIGLSCPEPYCDHVQYLPVDATVHPRGPLPQTAELGERQVS